MYKYGILLCSYSIANDSNLLLSFQYTIIDYNSKEKSSIMKSERPSLVNLKNFGYNILKNLKNKTIKDFSELDLYFK